MTTKQDIAVVFNTEFNTRDIAVGDDGDLESVDGYSTSLSLSILTNQRADSSEVAQPLNRKGWIGDLTPKTFGREIGSKVWLFYQSRVVDETVNGIRNAMYDGLMWMLQDSQISNLEVTAEKSGSNGIVALVTINVANNTVRRYFNFWDDTEERNI